MTWRIRVGRLHHDTSHRQTCQDDVARPDWAPTPRRSHRQNFDLPLLFPPRRTRHAVVHMEWASETATSNSLSHGALFFFPERSQFELPFTLENRFLHLSEVRRNGAAHQKIASLC